MFEFLTALIFLGCWIAAWISWVTTVVFFVKAMRRQLPHDPDAGPEALWINQPVRTWPRYFTEEGRDCWRKCFFAVKAFALSFFFGFLVGVVRALAGA